MDNDVLEQIRKTDARVFFFGAIAFLALIGPVMIEIYVAAPDAFLSLTVSKLVLLAMGASLPVAVLNTMLCFAATKHDKESQILPGTPELNASAGLLITALFFYIDVGLQFLVGYSFRVFVIVGIVLELAVIVWSVVQIVNTNKTAK
mgnify:FL=1